MLKVFKKAVKLRELIDQHPMPDEIWCNYIADSFGVREFEFTSCEWTKKIYDYDPNVWIKSETHTGVRRTTYDIAIIYEMKR